MLMDPFATGGCGFTLNYPQWTTPYKYLFSQMSLKQLRLYLITTSENIFIFNLESQYVLADMGQNEHNKVL